MKHIVGVADMKISGGAGDIIVTHALGSCLGVSAYDATAQVGGILHVMMPVSSINPEKAKANPCMFVDTALPAFFRALYDKGAEKKRLIVKVAGGANVQGNGSDRFAIGKRNYIMLKKVFWKNSALIDSEDVGGTKARTMYIEIGSGRVWLSNAGSEWDL
ncbi:MAG: chemotaxis protein CheD [Planctomycetes bacterium]|nr:chemotaxis protein CheD [Phycisphaerae bacterium]NBB95533.1 chemotaxis protein CheD [Planctomycetota bacterium]